MLVGEGRAIESADLVCPKCKMFGCTCNPPETPKNRSAMADTCTICHRPKGACICRSHCSFKPLPDNYEPSGPARRKLSRQEVEGRVNEAVNAYYDKDPMGLAALVRGWFS